jgi:hypothetical protein
MSVRLWRERSGWYAENDAVSVGRFSSARAAWTALMTTHADDDDCTLGPDGETCAVCGASHASSCSECGGRAFHRKGCSAE